LRAKKHAGDAWDSLRELGMRIARGTPV